MGDTSCSEQGRMPAAVVLASASFRPAELRVLRELLAGKSDREIARTLDRCESTVKTHLHHMFVAAGVLDRTQLVGRIMAHRCWYVDSRRIQPDWLQDNGPSPVSLQVKDLLQTLERLHDVSNGPAPYGSVARHMRETMIHSARTAFDASDLSSLVFKCQTDELPSQIVKEVGAARAWLDALL